MITQLVHTTNTCKGQLTDLIKGLNLILICIVSKELAFFNRLLKWQSSKFSYICKNIHMLEIIIYLRNFFLLDCLSSI